MVFLSNKNFNTERLSRKLDNKRWGPFKVIELIGLSYRVKWTGWDDDQHWYNANNGEFDNAQDIVDDFHRRYPNKPR